ncbi:MAG: glycosyltransferase family 39 protein [Pirellulales bacterium]
MNERGPATYVPLLCAVLTAALLQAILIARMPTISADGIIFAKMARALERSPIAAFRDNDQHPGYPAALLVAGRAVQWLGVHGEPQAWIVGGRAVSFACGLLSVWVVWRLARDLYDTRVANLAAFIFAILPLPRLFAADAQSDVPHMCFYLIAAWLATVGIKSNRILPLAGAGAASGIAFWIRPEGLEVFLVAMVFVVYLGLRDRCSWRRIGLAASSLAAATVLIAAPYPLLAGKITSKQLPFFKEQPADTFIEQVAAAPAPAHASVELPPPPDRSKSANPAAADVPNTPPTPGPLAAAEGAAPAAAAVDHASAPPTAARPALPIAPAPEPVRRYTLSLVAWLAGSALVALVESFCQAFRFVFIPLYLLGQWEMVRRGTPPRLIAFLWVLAALHMLILVWVFFVSGYISSRHVLPLVGLAMPFTALGLLYAEEQLGKLVPSARSWIAVGGLAVCSLIVLPYSVRSYNREFIPVIQAAGYVQSLAGPGVGVVCNSPYVGFYGQLPTTILGPDALNLDAALARGQAGVQYDYVVLHVNAHDYRGEWISQIETRYRPLREYADPTEFHRPRKVIVYEAIEAHARRVGGQRS